MVDPEFAREMVQRQAAWRRVVGLAVQKGISAQRDYFGAHTYERVDKSGAYHTEWAKLARKARECNAAAAIADYDQNLWLGIRKIETTVAMQLGVGTVVNEVVENPERRV
ncbi:hypothetical protein H5410_062877 [Solanum commersonii]|uniref:phosphogluconate dehydrogenase (NADP(+)-dependent, decarboxylating) n=1 Tax=Solanum commersonii TaxID=4109 RepID=A0A9J5WCR7_SOLCO|nr:hypothetical protein H5410_062877 [Solanum commersonii]